MNKEYVTNTKVKQETVLPNEQLVITEDHWNGEQQLNKSTGQVEVYYNGEWSGK